MAQTNKSQKGKENSNYRHGHNQKQPTPTYKSWDNMRQRCTNIKHHKYSDYGGRGIKVCSGWKNFKNFLKAMGERPKNLTLDRIDVNGHYTPDNCRWADGKIQRRNQR